MPRYMLLFLEEPGRGPIPAADRTDTMAKMGRFAGELAQQGKLQGGNPLKAEATRVAVHGGKPSVTDGPFAETKETVGGFFVVEAADRKEAVELAKRAPHLAIGPVEVREVIEVGPRP